MDIASKLRDAKQSLENGKHSKARHTIEELEEFADQVQDRLPEESHKAFKMDLLLAKGAILHNIDKSVRKLDEMASEFDRIRDKRQECKNSESEFQVGSSDLSDDSSPVTNGEDLNSARRSDEFVLDELERLQDAVVRLEQKMDDN